MPENQQSFDCALRYLVVSINYIDFSWMGVEVNSIYKRINAAITRSSADIEDLKKSVGAFVRSTTPTTSTIYGEISLLYDSSFVFTEPYREVFRQVISSYLDSVHSDAVNILSVEDLFPPNSDRRLESSNHTLNFKPFAPHLGIMPKRVQTSKSRFVFASLNKSSPTKRKSSGNFKETLQKFNNRRGENSSNLEYQ